MKMKRFFAPDIRQAMRVVREELGADAVILSNRRVDGGIEIIAAMDFDEALYQEQVSGAKPTSIPKRESAESIRQSPPRSAVQASRHVVKPAPPVEERKERAQTSAQKAVWAEDPVMAAMRDELKDLRGLIETQLLGFAWGDIAKRHPLHARIVRRLMGMGLSSEVSQRIVKDIKEDIPYDHAWRLALGVIGHHIKSTEDDILSRGGVVALIGPTGVGKTTTIAKLAARYTLRHGNGRVALITTDNYRIGAHEQLRTYGQILGAPVFTASNIEELETIISSQHDRELVLIDTAGMSQRDIRLTNQIAMLKTELSEVRNYLVLSSTAQGRGLDEAVQAFSNARLSGCILTKLDETASLGEALSAVMKYKLPVAYYSDGQQVPEDLHPARAPALVAKCVAMADKGLADLDETRMELEYGRMVANADA